MNRFRWVLQRVLIDVSLDIKLDNYFDKFKFSIPSNDLVLGYAFDFFCGGGGGQDV